MCTGIFLKTKNGKYVFARTLEFGMPLKWIQFCSYKIKGTVGYFQNDTQNGFMTDGVNINGLFVGTFYYPHYDNQYSKHKINGKVNIETGNLNLYLLDNCKSVHDVINILHTLNIIETKIDSIAFSLHWIVCDIKGNCIVIEVKNKKTVYYYNKHNIITNSPSFPRHIVDLKNYKFLSKYNKPDSISEGTGALGLPGDSSSQSRFVRANFFRKNMPIPENTSSGIDALLRVMHNFDIPLGSVVDPKNEEKEVTQYTVAYSLNDIYSQYADYGYIVDRSGNWKQTRKPVKICNSEGITILLLLLLLIIFIICAQFCQTSWSFISSDSW